LASALRAIAESLRPKSAGASGPVPNACPWLRTDGQRQTPDLTLRAHRLHNRSEKAAAVYLRKHLILARGRYSDGS
jgi:hypothetical protein